MRNKIKIDLKSSIATKIFVVFFGLVTSIIIARILGPQGKGLLELYLVAPLIVISFTELGIRQAVAHFVGQKKYSQSNLYSSLILLYLISGLISIVAIGLIYFSSGLLDNFWLPFLFIVFALLSLLERYLGGILIGQRKVLTMNLVSLSYSFGKLIFYVILIWVFKLSVLGAAIGLALAQIISLVIVITKIDNKKRLYPRWLPAIFSKIVKKGFVYALGLFALTLIYKVDVYMLGILQTQSDVGIYSVGVKVSELLKIIPLSIGMVIFSYAANWQNNSKLKSKVEKIVTTCRIMTWLVFFGGIFLSIAGYYLIPLFYGQEFTSSYYVMLLLLPGMLFLTPFLILNLFITGQGRPKITLCAMGPALIVNIITNCFLISNLSYFGAAIASTISYLLGALIYIYIFNKFYHYQGLKFFLVLTKSDYKLVKSFLLGS